MRKHVNRIHVTEYGVSNISHYWKKAIEKDYIFLNAIFIKSVTMSRLVKYIWKYHRQKRWVTEFKYRKRGNRDISFKTAARELYCVARYYTALHQWFCIVRYFVWKTLRYKISSIMISKYIIIDHGEIFCLLIRYKLSL